MKNFWKWLIGIVVVLVVLFALPLAYHSLFGYGPGYGMYAYGMPMMGRGYGGYGMMHLGFFSPFGMFFAWLVPLGLLFLLVYGIVWLVNRRSTPAAPTRTCANCGKPAQADWKNCPYCGSTL
jgi:hypothetical protein